MQKHSIKDVPMYFTQYTNDCFQNAYGSIVTYLGLNPDIILADYFSFVYDNKTGFAGINYVLKEGIAVQLSEEELNVSLEYVKFSPPTYFSKREKNNAENLQNDRINISWYIEDDQDIAFSRMKELIDSDMPVVIIVDMFYMHYHKAYKKEHGLHAVVVTGYNEDENYVELFDKYRFSNSDFEGRVPIDELLLARSSENESGGTIKPIKNLWMEFSNTEQFYYNDDRWKCIIKESYRRMIGETKILGLGCGLNSLDEFRKDLLAKKNEKPEPELMNTFRFYYSALFRNLSRGRKRFSAFINTLDSKLPEDLINDVTNLLQQVADYWEICANLIIRLSITKKMDSIDKLDEQLALIRTNEKTIIDKLYNYIK